MKDLNHSLTDIKKLKINPMETSMKIYPETQIVI